VIPDVYLGQRNQRNQRIYEYHLLVVAFHILIFACRIDSDECLCQVILLDPATWQGFNSVQLWNHGLLRL
jgi:hypothetical protein